MGVPLRPVESLQCGSQILIGPLRSHALPCPGGVDTGAWKSRSATGKSLHVAPAPEETQESVSSAGDREPSIMTHLISGPTQKPFLQRQDGMRGGRGLSGHPGSGSGLDVWQWVVTQASGPWSWAWSIPVSPHLVLWPVTTSEAGQLVLQPTWGEGVNPHS